MASEKDPGFVKTNLFKAETENSVVHITEEIPVQSLGSKNNGQIRKKMRRRKFTRPPSTVLEEIEKENRMLGINSNSSQGKRGLL